MVEGDILAQQSQYYFPEADKENVNVLNENAIMASAFSYQA